MRYCSMLILATLCFAENVPANVVDADGVSGYKSCIPQRFRTPIAQVGDVNAILGPQGKNICISGDGMHVAVIYGGPTVDPLNCMEVMIAYSTDAGSTWTHYGPFSDVLYRIYASVDGHSDFDDHPEYLWFAWQETPYGSTTSEIKVMNLTSSAVTLPSSSKAGARPARPSSVVCGRLHSSLSTVTSTWLSSPVSLSTLSIVACMGTISSAILPASTAAA